MESALEGVGLDQDGVTAPALPREMQNLPRGSGQQRRDPQAGSRLAGGSRDREDGLRGRCGA